MRFDGTLKSWNDERGFGFIEPMQGGQDIFVHVKAFRGPRHRPQVDQRVSFQVELGPRGKKRAFNVQFAPPRRPARATLARRQGPASWGTASLAAIPLFAAVLAIGHAWGRPPRWLLWADLGLSVASFLAYAQDKSAARRGAWRTPESTLHLLAALGGWPGALLAQQMLRHKSAKAEFRATFWTTVVLNVGLFTFLASPASTPLVGALAQLLGFTTL